MTRDKFEQLNQALFLRCLETVKRVLKVTPNERTTETDNIWADDRIQYQDLF
jgi:molecular chaperone DnaK (HSP70)